MCIAPQKLDRVLALRRQGCRLTILVDEAAAARAVVAKGTAEQHAFDVMIEVDTDGHRSGVKPDDDALIEIARILHAGGAALRGVMTHAGSSYELDTPDALARLAEQERAGCVRAAERLRAAGLPCAEVSVGSTPTALSANDLAGVTEVRAGVYVFFDLVMANVGVCTPRDIALSVLTTVIGHQADKGWAIVDAGWMAMSRDRGTARQRVDYGYGAVCDAAGEPIDGFVLYRGQPGARHRGARRRRRRAGHRGALSGRHAAARAAQPRLRDRRAVRSLSRGGARRRRPDLATFSWLVRRATAPPAPTRTKSDSPVCRSRLSRSAARIACSSPNAWSMSRLTIT